MTYIYEAYTLVLSSSLIGKCNILIWIIYIFYLKNNLINLGMIVGIIVGFTMGKNLI